MGNQTITRRSVAKGAAWSVPAVAVAGAAPAVAASNPATITVGGTVCNIFNGSGTANAQTEKIYWSFTSSTGVIPAGTVITHQICVDPSTNPGGLTDWYVPTNTYPAGYTPTSTNGPWYIDFTASSGVPLAPNTRLTGAQCFNVNFHFNQDVNVADLGCLNGILWDSGTSNLWLRPGSTLTITDNASVTGAQSVGSGTLKYQVTQRYPASINSSGRIPTNFISKSGVQSCYPSVSSSQILQSDGADDVVCYPSGTNITTARCSWGGTTCSASSTGLCTPPYKGAVSGQTDIPSMC